jgi:hypothetical protein
VSIEEKDSKVSEYEQRALNIAAVRLSDMKSGRHWKIPSLPGFDQGPEAKCAYAIGVTERYLEDKINRLDLAVVALVGGVRQEVADAPSLHRLLCAALAGSRRGENEGGPFSIARSAFALALEAQRLYREHVANGGAS